MLNMITRSASTLLFRGGKRITVLETIGERKEEGQCNTPDKQSPSMINSEQQTRKTVSFPRVIEVDQHPGHPDLLLDVVTNDMLLELDQKSTRLRKEFKVPNENLVRNILQRPIYR
ncbi:hypothetical protein SARC_08220 [Sphaeroforma arctica JP610]|uniref:Uncharacterized protein n=1 Tax=Sphaeroforma arctica JP610 TaxID=667725 RepID=A0A0L0FRR4_9EUKA|nr:hypothetical protein SARC_08220 [Sphaeroforma arctica JP610]KNC79384.1 hypothetical protein SARC_08220 [Sphaeroforma arctica JP610]|eukprot:XP_014153286.1 hypothetical protein SARC_08220 [Sphaeroforma arctica JP610]